MNMDKFELLVLGASFGGIQTLTALIPVLSTHTTLPMLIVQHTKPSRNNYFVSQMKALCKNHAAKEAAPGDRIQDHHIYIAPGDYHVLVEQDRHINLSLDEQVKFSRPSIDVLFESAADAYERCLVGILLTGANNDGSNGIAYIHDLGGVTVVQDPIDAIFPTMPQSAIDTKKVDYIVPMKDIPNCLCQILKKGPKEP